MPAPIPLKPYVVYGIVRKNGIAQVGVTVTIENITLGGSATRTTESNGSYVYDSLTQLPNSYVATNVIKVSIDGSAHTFIAAASPEKKLINFFYNTYTIDTLFKKLNIDNTYKSDTLFKKLNIDNTYILDTIIINYVNNPYVIDLLFKKPNVDKSMSLDVYIGEVIEEVPEKPEKPKAPLQQYGGMLIQPSALEQIRELFGLSSEITEERKIKKSISSKILVNYTYNNNLIGKVYDDVYKESNISAMAVLSYPTLQSKIYGNLYNPLEKNYDINSLIYNNILKKITRGFIIQDSMYNSDISGQLLNNIRKSDSLIGNIYLDKLKKIKRRLLLGRF